MDLLFSQACENYSCTEISDFSFNFQHISGKHMFVSDFLSWFSSDDKEDEPILYLTDTSLLKKRSIYIYLCYIKYNTGQGVCTSHLFPITRSQAILQKIAIPSLFTPSRDRPVVKASILRDPPAVLTRKRSTALPPLDVSQPAPEKWRRGHPPKKRAIDPILPLPEAADIVAEDLNVSLPTLYQVRRRRWQPTPATPQVEAPPEL